MRLPTAVLVLIFAALTEAIPLKYGDKKNIIFMVSDGMGLSSITNARQYVQSRDNTTYDGAVLEIENYLIGTVRTQSSSALITDSAAAGSAFANGVKTYNGAISVDPSGKPRGTFYEGAKLLNYTTGIVSTTFVQDATICTPNTHVLSRKYYDLIAEQQLGYGHPLGQTIDIVMGGGRQYLHGANSTKYPTKGKRADGVDYISKAQQDGWTYVGDRKSFDQLYESDEVKLPLLALFGADSLPYEIDRNASQVPSLAEMSLLAIDQLVKATENSTEGFVLLLEGARIDHAAHANDPVAIIEDTIAHADAFKAVIDRVSQLDTETIVVSTSDHETGGFGMGANGVYEWWPQNYFPIQKSTEYAINKLKAYTGDNSTKAEYFKAEILTKQMNFTNFTDTEIDEVLKAEDMQVSLAHLVSNAVNLGWTSTAHTQQDVPLYAWANTEEAYYRTLAALGSSVENTEIPEFFAQELGVDLDQVTELIQDIKVKP
jgi:alkaline phosphatase